MSRDATVRDRLVAAAHSYYDACNRADVEAMAACFAPEAIHYFPAGAPQGTFAGSRAIAQGWADAVARLDSRWTIDHLVVDEASLEVVIEWTHWKPNRNGYLRGSETCVFDEDGRMTEIRAYYAAPPTAESHELGDFPYATRGIAVSPPHVERLQTGT